MRAGQKKLTKRVIDALQADPNGRDVIHFDSEVPRFGVRVKPSGVKSYVLQYRNKYGQARRFTIARVGDITPTQARERALILRGEIAAGGDPSGQRRADRDAKTVGELCDDYMAAAAGRLKPNSLKTNRSGLVHHVKPLIGAMPVETVTPAVIEKFVSDVAAGKTGHKATDKRKPGGVTTGGDGAASRILAVLGAVFQRAVRDGLLAKNPVREVEKIRLQPKRPPPFSFETITALGKALREREAADEHKVGLCAVRFLLLSGCRRMECLTLKWAMIDTRARCVRFPDTKTGPAIRPLGRAALDLLAAIKPANAKADAFVFPGNTKHGHFNDLPRTWRRACKAAGITGASIHTLRHWFASCGAEMNISELLIAGLLGHRVRSVTGRYATAPDAALLATADRVSLRLADALDGVETGKIISLSA